MIAGRLEDATLVETFDVAGERHERRRVELTRSLPLGYHRIELEVYGFNERAQRHAERSGFVREGVKRQAYRRGDGWVDGGLYALVAEDLEPPR